MVELTEDRTRYLIGLAQKYAKSRNLDPIEYVTGMLDADRVGDADAGELVETLIRYHTGWLRGE